MKYLTAFLIGGLICALVQILMDNTKLLPGRIMVILIGIFKGWFIACAVGVAAALVFSYIATFFFKPRMKK